MSALLQVRVISPWFGESETEHAFFSVHLPPERADALLCDWAPSGELFAFPGTKAWYCCEPPAQFRSQAGGTWTAIRSRLAAGEFLFYNHPNPRFRVPHITHYGKVERNWRSNRLNRAIAVVSNAGPAPWRRTAAMCLRVHFCTQPNVDLYGRHSGWVRCRKRFWSPPALPANYVNELTGDWSQGAKGEMLSRYKVAVCLENSYEPNYFTEKFVDAVKAGCIPVYHAHETVRHTFLRDAKWVDPEQFEFDPEATIHYALEQSAGPYWEANGKWIESEQFATTSAEQVLGRIGTILVSQHGFQKGNNVPPRA